MNPLATLFVLFFLYSQPIPVASVSVVKPDTQGLESINAYRAEHGLKPVIRSKSVCRYAELRASQIKTDWSHKGFFDRRDSRKGGHWIENLAKGFPNSPLEAWKKSPTHNANLLADVTEMCVVQNGTYWALEGWHQ